MVLKASGAFLLRPSLASWLLQLYFDSLLQKNQPGLSFAVALSSRALPAWCDPLFP